MAFGSFDSKSSGGAVSEINMVPLIDVMLVLLVIFIITAPLMAHSIRINTPKVSAEQIEEEPKSVDLAIDPAGMLFVNDEPTTLEELPDRFRTLLAAEPKANLRIRADLDTRYEILTKVMAAARRSGMSRIGFITTPVPGQNGSALPANAAASGIALAPPPATQ